MNALDAGTTTLGLSLASSTAAFLFALAAARFESRKLLVRAKLLLALTIVLLSAAMVILLILFLRNDFRAIYVIKSSERALPLGFKIAALWAGHAGSLLLWAWMLAGMAVISLLWAPRAKERGALAQQAVAAMTLAAIVGFFVIVILYAASPFRAVLHLPADGRGMNAQLQNFEMIIHPPVLFLGYAGFTIPFAFMFGALISRRTDDAWVWEIRRWILMAWVFLTVGILLGAQWAYVQSGWGGYWSWDPVENASLLPWLTATGLLHASVAQEQRGMLRFWNATLIAVTFLLCIFATYITRSGVIQSVHAFERSSIGTYFLVFLAIAFAASLALLLVRQSQLRPKVRMGAGDLVSREGAFVAAILLLLAIMLLTLLGTVFPLISAMMDPQHSVTATPEFYNYKVLPLALTLIALMALGPALASGSPRQILRRMIWPAGGALAGVAVLGIVDPGYLNVWSVVVTAAAAAALACILRELHFAWSARRAARQETPVLALLRLLNSNRRRYGAQVVHLGMVMIAVGIVGSSLFKHQGDWQLALGDSASFVGETLTYDEFRHIKRDNYVAYQASVTWRQADGQEILLRPERRYYGGEPATPNAPFRTEIAIDSNLRRDLYLALADTQPDGSVITLRAFVNPLVDWIWIGGIVMVLGVFICLLPRHAAQQLTEPGLPEEQP